MIGGGNAVASAGEVMAAGRTAVNSVAKLADMLVSAFRVTVQLPMPLHAPPQPARPHPAAGVPVSVTEVPWAKLALQVAPQSMPEAELVTVPPGLPKTETERLYLLPV